MNRSVLQLLTECRPFQNMPPTHHPECAVMAGVHVPGLPDWHGAALPQRYGTCRGGGRHPRRRHHLARLPAQCAGAAPTPAQSCPAAADRPNARLASGGCMPLGGLRLGAWSPHQQRSAPAAPYDSIAVLGHTVLGAGRCMDDVPH